MRIIMRNFSILAALLTVTLLAACGQTRRSHNAAALDDVESFINEDPDSALAVLQGIDSTRLGHSLHARYALLRVMALDKSYKDITTPDLLEPAVQWYAHHGSPDEKMKISFYQGRIAQDRKNFNVAAMFFANAEEYADAVTDKHALGILYLAQSTLYTSVHNNDKATEYCEKGLAVFKETDDPFYEKAAGQLASYLIVSREWERADSLFRKGIDSSRDNPHAMSVFLSNYAMLKLLQPEPEPEEAIRLLDRSCNEYGNSLSLNQAGAYAYALALSGKDKEAKTIIGQLKDNMEKDPLSVEYWLSRCAWALGDYENAYNSFARAHVAEEAIIRSTLSDSISDYISEHNKKVAEERRVLLRTVIFIMAIILLLFFMALTLVLFRKEKLETEKNQMLSICSLLEKEASEQRIQTEHLQEQLQMSREMAQRERVIRFKQAGRLQTSIWRLEHAGPSWFRITPDMDIIKKELSYIYDIDDTADVMTSRLDRELGGVLMRLIEELQLKDKPQEQLFLCCCLLNLPADIIAARFSITQNNVRVRKSRLKAQIVNLKNEDYNSLFGID